jgi:hypothetical protein
VRVFLCEPAGPENKFKPLRPPPLSAQFAPAQKITLGDNPDKLAVLIDYRQAADAILKHQARGLEDRFVGANADDVRRHYVSDSHGHTLVLEVANRDQRACDHAASAARFRNTMRREQAETSIAEAVSSEVRVRHTVSMVNPR